MKVQVKLCPTGAHICTLPSLSEKYGLAVTAFAAWLFDYIRCLLAGPVPVGRRGISYRLWPLSDLSSARPCFRGGPK